MITVTLAAEKTAEEIKADQDSADKFKNATYDWISHSSGADDGKYKDTITSELLDFVGTLGKLAKNIGDVLSVVNKYI